MELATNDEERERGLMFRRSVPDGTGMLFDFKRDQDVSFWMKNLCVARHDLYSRRRSDSAHRREHHAGVLERLVPSGGPVRAVLEVG